MKKDHLFPHVAHVSISAGFDISEHIRLVPPFHETEVDSYFGAFERRATALNWRFCWSLLQCKLVGKTQEVCTSLPTEQSLDYELKNILHTYEPVLMHFNKI